MSHLMILVGMSGSGKSYTASQLVGMGYEESVSTTTRQPRSGEVNGVSYYFQSRGEFLAGIDAGEFIEFEDVYGEFYGTSFDSLRRSLTAAEKGVVVVIEPKGAYSLAEYAHQQNIPYVLVFVDANINDVLKALFERIKLEPTNQDHIQRVLKLCANESSWKKSLEWNHIMMSDRNPVQFSESLSGLLAVEPISSKPVKLYEVSGEHQEDNHLRDLLISGKHEEALLYALNTFEPMG